MPHRIPPFSFGAQLGASFFPPASTTQKRDVSVFLFFAREPSFSSAGFVSFDPLDLHRSRNGCFNLFGRTPPIVPAPGSESLAKGNAQLRYHDIF